MDVLALEWDPLLPKELLGGLAVPSTWLMIQDHLFHGILLSSTCDEPAIPSKGYTLGVPHIAGCEVGMCKGVLV